MARVKIEEIIQNIDYGVRRALAEAVKETIPDAEFDEHDLFRAFVRSVRRKCNTWERVSDSYIETD